MVMISKVTRHTTTESTTHRSTGYFWDDHDLDKLRSMLEEDVDQVEILRAFPDYTWKALTERAITSAKVGGSHITAKRSIPVT